MSAHSKPHRLDTLGSSTQLEKVAENADNSKPDALPILENRTDDSRRPTKHLNAGLTHPIFYLRLAVLIGIVVLVHFEHRRFTTQERFKNQSPTVKVSLLKTFLPNATKIADWNADGKLPILDSNQKTIGFAIHTSTLDQPPIGYVGRTDLLVVFNQDGEIEGVVITQSDDTQEHVQEIVDDPNYLKSWTGLTWEEALEATETDAVSGATLTCYAIEQTLKQRLGARVLSFKFPNSVTLEEIREYFPNADTIQPNSRLPSIQEVYKQGQDKSDKEHVGSFIRSSPVADGINGFQGPSDVLIILDADLTFRTMSIRSSFDNQEPETYVDYVREEEYFLSDKWLGMSPEDLLEVNPDDVEGVSGATMTSHGVFNAMQHAIKKALQEPPAPKTRSIVLSWRDLGTTLVLLGALLLTFTSMRKKKSLRLPFQVGLVVYFGFINGDLLSQTLLAGWVQNGVAWRQAMGIILLTIAAFSIPLFTGKNLYCQKVCPFGAAQHLVARLNRSPKRLPRNLDRWLKKIPGLLVLIVVVTTFTHLQVNLAALEPFDAFSIGIAGFASITLAVCGLLFAFYVPLGYCRYGCPTGYLLNLFRPRRSNLLMRDGIAIAVLLVAVLIFVNR